MKRFLSTMLTLGLVVTILLVLPASAVAAEMGWVQMESGTTNTLYGIWGTSSSDIFVAGKDGTILRYDGSSWSQMTSSSEVYLYDIWGSSSNDVFAVGEKGIVLHYDGTSWSQITGSLSDYSLYGVWGSSANDVFVVGSRYLAL